LSSKRIEKGDYPLRLLTLDAAQFAQLAEASINEMQTEAGEPDS
jgi:hypothetical protein